MARIRNWEKFQHYKHRHPLWIKLYSELLDDKQWHELSGESAKGLIMLWLIASEENGEIPDTTTLAFRLRISENRAIALLSDLSHWIEYDASNMLATCYQVASTEKSREEKKNPPYPPLIRGAVEKSRKRHKHSDVGKFDPSRRAQYESEVAADVAEILKRHPELA